MIRTGLQGSLRNFLFKFFSKRSIKYDNFQSDSKRFFNQSRLLKQQKNGEIINSEPKLSKEEFFEYMNQKRNNRQAYKTKTTINYAFSVIIGFITLSYASVPLYRALCSRTGYGGTPMTDQKKFSPDKLIPVDTNKKIRIAFTSETSVILPWKFVPQQREVYLVPGETALAFYKAKNTSKEDITGMATYSVTPGEAAPYFNKIQCFCFEEQRLLAGEEVDMPVFFFIDPDFVKDPQMRNIDDIVLHYTFFKAHKSDNK